MFEKLTELKPDEKSLSKGAKVSGSSNILMRHRKFSLPGLVLILAVFIGFGTFVVLKSRAATSSMLPFDMPDTATLRNSPKKVFAHYWPLP